MQATGTAGSALSGRSQGGDSTAGPSESDSDSVAEEKSHNIKGLLGKRVKDGVTEYRVNWVNKKLRPSWEPEGNIDQVAIQIYEDRVSQSTSRGGRAGRGRSRSRSSVRGRGASKGYFK